MGRAIDALIAYRLLKLLVTPFNKTKAYQMGIIDAKGKVLIKKNQFDRKIPANKRAEAIQMFDALFWGSWIACDEMPEQAREWLDARVKDYKDGTKMDFICDCRKFRGNDADKTQASEMTRAEYPFDCHGYTLKKHIEEEASK